ncbi:hypothetical protein C7S17_7031 [Burkholderia thailandensis]|nr:hypothetical protein [Burkholderia thailandensis]
MREGPPRQAVASGVRDKAQRVGARFDTLNAGKDFVALTLRAAAIVRAGRPRRCERRARGARERKGARRAPGGDAPRADGVALARGHGNARRRARSRAAIS